MATHSSVLAWRVPRPWDRGAWWAAVYGVAQSWTRLKQLSSSSFSFSSSSRNKVIYLKIFMYLLVCAGF